MICNTKDKINESTGDKSAGTWKEIPCPLLSPVFSVYGYRTDGRKDSRKDSRILSGFPRANNIPRIKDKWKDTRILSGFSLLLFLLSLWDMEAEGFFGDTLS